MSIFSRLLRTCVLTALGVVGHGAHVVDAQDIVSDGAFRQATKEQKKKALNNIVLQPVGPPPSDLQALLRAGLEDEDPEIRARALSALGGRAQGERFCPTDEMRTRWRLERQALLGLRGDVIRALEDPDPLVRREAIYALGSLDYEVGRSREHFLSADTLQRLIDAFRREQSFGIRALIINDLSLSGDDSPVLLDLFMSVLDTSARNGQSAGFEAQAARGLASAKRIEALPKLVPLLTHPDQHVRLAVSQAVASFRELAIPYLSEVDNAAQVETDPIIKKTLEGTRKLLMEARAAQQRPK